MIVTTISKKSDRDSQGSVEQAVSRPRQRLHVVEKGGIITLVPEVPLKSLKGTLKGLSKIDLREKKDRS